MRPVRRPRSQRSGGAGLDEDDVEEAEHGRAAVLDLHDLVAGHVARLNEASRGRRRRPAEERQCHSENIWTWRARTTGAEKALTCSRSARATTVLDIMSKSLRKRGESRGARRVSLCGVEARFYARKRAGRCGDGQRQYLPLDRGGRAGLVCAAGREAANRATRCTGDSLVKGGWGDLAPISLI